MHIYKIYVAFLILSYTFAESEKDDTTKLLVELQDGHRIESVIIRHRHYATLCVSSQIGCAMGCKFCATGNTQNHPLKYREYSLPLYYYPSTQHKTTTKE